MLQNTIVMSSFEQQWQSIVSVFSHSLWGWELVLLSPSFLFKTRCNRNNTHYRLPTCQSVFSSVVPLDTDGYHNLANEHHVIVSWDHSRSGVEGRFPLPWQTNFFLLAVKTLQHWLQTMSVFYIQSISEAVWVFCTCASPFSVVQSAFVHSGSVKLSHLRVLLSLCREMSYLLQGNEFSNRADHKNREVGRVGCKTASLSFL